MPLILRRTDGSMKIPERVFEILLTVANQRDWIPLGPDIPGKRRVADPKRYQDKDWRDDYFTPEGQYITEDDALGIAAALKIFLPEVPDDDSPPAVEDDHTHLAELPVSPHELFRGDGKQLIREFIEFCENGGFFIQAGSGLGA